MGRGRISMELIQKEKARKITFQKRKNGLMKKVYEFSILCGVDVCLIIYAPNFEGQGLAEPETWPQDKTEVQRILQKYYNTTSDKRPKIFDVEEYYKERIKKVEAEISKVHKEMLRIKYPTWNDSFNALQEEELRMFASMLDSKLDACNQKMNILKGDPKGKAIAESNPNSHFNLMVNMPQAQLPPPPMESIIEPFWQFQLGQSSHSQPSLVHFGQNGMMDWVNQAGDVNCDSKIGIVEEDEAENNYNSSPFYYNGNTQTMQSYPIALQTQLPSQSLSNLPPGFQVNGFYDPNIFQPHMFNHMHGRK